MQVSTAKRFALSAAVAVAFVLWTGAAASATDHVIASDAESITVDQAIEPGQSVTLPVFGIYNKGTMPADYEMVVVAIASAQGVDASWVDFSPRTFSLDPGGVGRITATVYIPSGALPGTYQALLASRLVNPGGSGVAMSVGIGPMLTFEVAEGSPLSAAWYRVTGFFSRHAPWSYFGSIVLALAALAGVAAQQADASRRPTQFLDALLHAPLTATAFHVFLDLSGTALSQVHVGGFLSILRFNSLDGHAVAPDRRGMLRACLGSRFRNTGPPVGGQSVAELQYTIAAKPARRETGAVAERFFLMSR